MAMNRTARSVTPFDFSQIPLAPIQKPQMFMDPHQIHFLKQNLLSFCTCELDQQLSFQS